MTCTKQLIFSFSFTYSDREIIDWTKKSITSASTLLIGTEHKNETGKINRQKPDVWWTKSRWISRINLYLFGKYSESFFKNVSIKLVREFLFTTMMEFWKYRYGWLIFFSCTRTAQWPVYQTQICYVNVFRKSAMHGAPVTIVLFAISELYSETHIIANFFILIES